MLRKSNIVGWMFLFLLLALVPAALFAQTSGTNAKPIPQETPPVPLLHAMVQ